VSEFKFNFEITREGLAKTQALKDLPRAHKKILTEWLTGIVRLSKKEAQAMQKSKNHGGKKTGQLANNIGMEVTAGDDSFSGVVGTGVGGTESVQYAMIQDKGGLTRPEVTDKMRRFAWAMFFKTKDDKWKWLALTKKSVLEIVIPRSHWFTRPVETSKSMLDEMMKPENAFLYAMRMRGN
jgi:hypothetical protein